MPNGAVLDEVQRRPKWSGLQGLVDSRGIMGDCVPTGFAPVHLMAGITETLAACVGRVELLPLRAEERARAFGSHRLEHRFDTPI